MSITFVSALYNIYNFKEVQDILLKNTKDLLDQNYKLIMYVDEFNYNALITIGMSDNVRLIKYPIENINIYNMIISNKNLKLPIQRDEKKDTLEYMALMNSKVEFILKSLDIIDTEYVAWIDAGITKVFSDKQSFSKLNCKLNGSNVSNKILIPGCYNIKLNFPELCSGVRWVFLGGFFACNKNVIPNFYNLCIKVIKFFMDHSMMVWEVNIFAYIHSTHENVFNWYYGDHNNSLSHIPSEYIEN